MGHEAPSSDSDMAVNRVCGISEHESGLKNAPLDGGMSRRPPGQQERQPGESALPGQSPRRFRCGMRKTYCRAEAQTEVKAKHLGSRRMHDKAARCRKRPRHIGQQGRRLQLGRRKHKIISWQRHGGESTLPERERAAKLEAAAAQSFELRGAVKADLDKASGNGLRIRIRRNTPQVISISTYVGQVIQARAIDSRDGNGLLLPG
ncbi:hypothetical protein SODALDRAFT_357268 [Sodiomyces alkalinus F11]|uniref:Uncharacterized protein n=1 Tax=Sodiomyces alkalinus (strain CBS 110278 / VKM F-3762 / F11) TaxID=1314773 RepID=A0A3N2Q3J0_SODAK|nr:hypothetical protein SODALDRAFT_357268 [Sodiomyces alkalinus F11]ROT41238.1 hypothetical protein SODALDRAFT_357268 [Sodiomyces alkalinus F11]